MQHNILMFCIFFSKFTAKGCEVTGPGSVSSQKEHDMSLKTLVPVKMNSLRVQGQRVRSHYQSLPQRLLEWNLKVHVGIQEIQNEQDKITQVFRLFFNLYALDSSKHHAQNSTNMYSSITTGISQNTVVMMPSLLLCRSPLQRYTSCVRATLGWQMFICSSVSGVQPLQRPCVDLPP